MQVGWLLAQDLRPHAPNRDFSRVITASFPSIDMQGEAGSRLELAEQLVIHQGSANQSGSSSSLQGIDVLF